MTSVIYYFVLLFARIIFTHASSLQAAAIIELRPSVTYLAPGSIACSGIEPAVADTRTYMDAIATKCSYSSEEYVNPVMDYRASYWASAVTSGGLGCRFVPTLLCDLVPSCGLSGGQCQSSDPVPAPTAAPTPYSSCEDNRASALSVLDEFRQSLALVESLASVGMESQAEQILMSIKQILLDVELVSFPCTTLAPTASTLAPTVATTTTEPTTTTSTTTATEKITTRSPTEQPTTTETPTALPTISTTTTTTTTEITTTVATTEGSTTEGLPTEKPTAAPSIGICNPAGPAGLRIWCWDAMYTCDSCCFTDFDTSGRRDCWTFTFTKLECCGFE